jgi:RimJ/RimL family protein N-acetyltransferase
MIQFRQATLQDAKTLAKISERAFHSDAEYGAASAGGPPGYADDRGGYAWQIRMIAAAEYYKIIADHRIVGGIVFRPVAYQHYDVIRIFIEPDYQRQGIGTQAMAFMENLHPEVKRWTLRTPVWNTRTPQFYEKCGYEQVGTEGDSLLYEKRIE